MVLSTYLQTCHFSATTAVFLVNWVIHVNRIEPESFFLWGGGAALQTRLLLLDNSYN